MVVDGTPPEAMTDAAFDGRVSSIALGSRRVLDGIGLWPALAQDAQPILEIRVSDRDAPLFLHYDHRAVGDDPLGYIVENRASAPPCSSGRRRLRRCATSRRPRSRRWSPRGGRVEARLADGRCVRARLAVAADGARSRLRAAAGIETVRWSYEQVGIVCTVAHEREHRGIAHERFLPAGPFAILPMTGERSSLVWTERAALAPALLEAEAAVFARELGRRFGDFLGALEPLEPRWSYPLALTHAKALRRAAPCARGRRGARDPPARGPGLQPRHSRRRGAGRAGGRPRAPRPRHRRGRRARPLSAPAALRFRGADRGHRRAQPPLLQREPGAAPAPRCGLAAVNEMPPLKRFFMRHAMGLAGDLPASRAASLFSPPAS